MSCRMKEVAKDIEIVILYTKNYPPWHPTRLKVFGFHFGLEMSLLLTRYPFIYKKEKRKKNGTLQMNNKTFWGPKEPYAFQMKGFFLIGRRFSDSTSDCRWFSHRQDAHWTFNSQHQNIVKAMKNHFVFLISSCRLSTQC